MHKAEFQIASRAETERFGRLISELLEPGDVVGLCGDLGAGKTFLAGAIIHGLGVPKSVQVTSPTFTLIKEYKGNMPIYHMDLYRLTNASELFDLGLWEYYDGAGVCLVEWCERFDDLWPGHSLVICLELKEGEERASLARGDGRGEQLVRELETRWPSSKKKSR
jgi:tRNA threonylcarbamoyladenosine biosynthesis protein TsaE